MSNTRSFTVESVYRGGEKLRSEVGGRYNSISPSNAAKKAFSMAIRSINPAGRVSLEIHLKETTQGSDKKTYKYKVTKKNNKKTIQVGDREIVYKYETIVKSLNI
jgi:hypothetical protein